MTEPGFVTRLSAAMTETARDLSTRPRRVAWHGPDVAPAVTRSVRDTGLATWPGFLGDGECAEAREAIDALLAEPTTVVETDAAGSDHRIYGVDRLRSNLDLATNDRVRALVGNLFASNHLDAFTLAARLDAVPGNVGSGGGWHRDRAGRDQFKVIVYLSDVGPDNGPFQYLGGSARLGTILADTAAGFDLAGATRYADDAPLVQRARNLVTCTAAAGTMVIVNTRGVHRGAPILHGTRYALTAYFFETGIPASFDQLLNHG